MNPFYGRPGEFDRVEAIKHLISMCNRWAGQWNLFYDTQDKDFHVFGSRVSVPSHFVRIAYTRRHIPAEVIIDKESIRAYKSIPRHQITQRQSKNHGRRHQKANQLTAQRPSLSDSTIAML